MENLDFSKMEVLPIVVVDNCYNCDCSDGSDNDGCDCVSCDQDK